MPNSIDFCKGIFLHVIPVLIIVPWSRVIMNVLEEKICYGVVYPPHTLIELYFPYCDKFYRWCELQAWLYMWSVGTLELGWPKHVTGFLQFLYQKSQTLFCTEGCQFCAMFNFGGPNSVFDFIPLLHCTVDILSNRFVFLVIQLCDCVQAFQEFLCVSMFHFLWPRWIDGIFHKWSVSESSLDMKRNGTKCALYTRVSFYDNRQIHTDQHHLKIWWRTG